MAKQVVHTQIDGRELKLSNLEKVLYPDCGVTKAEIIEYFLAIYPHLLDFAADRPLTLIRFPDGIDAISFYSKNTPDYTPEWIPKSTLPWDSENVYSRLVSVADVIYFANLAALELHITSGKYPTIDCPDHFVIDLDPSEGYTFSDLKLLAVEIKQFLEMRGFVTYIKTSGGKGLHIIVPIQAIHTYDEVMDYFKGLFKTFIQTHPDATLKMSKDKRKGKVLLDIFRNHKGNTTVAPYSLRAKPGAPIAMPFPWEYLDDLPSAQHFTLKNYKDYNHFFGLWKDMDKSAKALTVNPTIKPINTAAMLAGVIDKINPKANDVFYEVKWDGIRACLIKQGKTIKIQSRSGRDITAQFPEFLDHTMIAANQCAIDGEIVVNDEAGRPQFSEVISRMHGKKNILKQNAVFYAFDCLYLDHVDITRRPIEERRETLTSLLLPNKYFRFSDGFEDGFQLLEAIKLQGMEGVMVKKKGSIYQPGQRTKDWLKLKIRHDATCYIVGYTLGSGDRSPYFGSLVLALKTGDDYVYKGRVGTGFNSDSLTSVLEQLKAAGVGKKVIQIKIDEENKTTWINPRLQCEISYASLSSNETYREPVFKTIINPIV